MVRKMKKLIIVLLVIANACWSIPKPMESIENYNVMIVHGAYSKDEGFLDEKDTNEAYYAGTSLENGATLPRPCRREQADGFS